MILTDMLEIPQVLELHRILQIIAVIGNFIVNELINYAISEKNALIAKFVITNSEHDIFGLYFIRKRAEQELRPLSNLVVGRKFRALRRDF
jgi:hypothetical protein